jgi:hypothetical protein
MRPLMYILCLIGFVIVSACSAPARSLKPGDKAGDLVLATNQEGTGGLPLFIFCEGGSSYHLGESAPEKNTFMCRVPAVPSVVIGPGWTTADAQLRDSNAAVMTTEMFIGDQQVDLAAFGSFDTEFTQPMRTADGEDVIPVGRQSNVMVVQPKPGTHTVRVVSRFSQEISDGFVTYTPGQTYEDTYTITFTTDPAETPPVYWR